MNKRFLHSVATLIGMIIGVGIFGIPYAVEKVGFVLGFFYILLLGLILLLMHLLYSEVTLRTEGKHRLVGYAEIYLGKHGKTAAALAQIFAFYGALIVYILIGGQFLQMILAPLFGGTLLVYQVAFFVFMSLAVLVGLRLIASIEFFMTILLLAVVAIIFIFGFSYVWYPNLYIMNPYHIFLPYGVILFALSGAAAIPSMREMLRGQESKMKTAIFWGTLIPIIISLLFAFVVIGVSGAETSPEAISGLARVLGEKVIIFGALFGFLAIATSFLVLGLNLKDIFRYDYKLNGWLAWLLACVAPFLVFLFSAPDFITVVTFTGAVFGGLEGILILLIWLKARKMGQRTPEYSFKMPKYAVYFLLAIFVLGMLHQIIFGS